MANYTVVSKSEKNGKTVIDAAVDQRFDAARRALQIVADHSSRLPDPGEPMTVGMPVGWIRGVANGGDGYSVILDTKVKHGGKTSATVKYTCGNDNDYGTLGQIYRRRRLSRQTRPFVRLAENRKRRFSRFVDAP